MPLWGIVVAVPAILYAVLAERTKCTPIRGSTVLVTGACTGLGKAVALEAARMGAKKVLLVSVREKHLDIVAKECLKLAKKTRHADFPDFEAKPIVLDVTDPEAVRKAAFRIYQEHGALDLLVNHAEASSWKSVDETTPEEAMEMMANPYQSAFTCTTLFVPAMAEHATGHVLNMTSAASDIGFSGGIGAGSAKWAVKGFSRT